MDQMEERFKEGEMHEEGEMCKERNENPNDRAERKFDDMLEMTTRLLAKLDQGVIQPAWGQSSVMRESTQLVFHGPMLDPRGGETLARYLPVLPIPERPPALPGPSRPMFLQKQEVDLRFVTPLELNTLFREYQGMTKISRLQSPSRATLRSWRRELEEFIC